MELQSYIDEIKLDVTGGILQLEIEDSTIAQIVNMSMRELQRYLPSTVFVTIPYSSCIDMSKYNVSSVSRIYRATPSGLAPGQDSYGDPMYVSFYQMASGYGNIYNLTDFSYNYGAWNTAQQIKNTISTDLSFMYDASAKKLYVNNSLDNGSTITVEYVPVYKNVADIVSDYWIDVLLRMAKANTKIILGRIRGRYTQTNALWTTDAATMLQEGQTELDNLRTTLQANNQLIYPVD